MEAAEEMARQAREEDGRMGRLADAVKLQQDDAIAVAHEAAQNLADARAAGAHIDDREQAAERRAAELQVRARTSLSVSPALRHCAGDFANAHETLRRPHPRNMCARGSGIPNRCHNAPCRNQMEFVSCSTLFILGLM